MPFGGQDLYPDVVSKAAAVCFFIVSNHPFVDGNKRTGHAAMELFLRLNGHSSITEVAEQEQVMLNLAAGSLSLDEFTTRVRAHTSPS